MVTEISNLTLNELLDVVKNHYGYDFSEYSTASIKRRILRFMQVSKTDNFFDLKHNLINNETYFVDFLQNITVNVTEMFRDPSFYIALREKVFPQLASYPFIKIWHAGCSTGEEVYSMAILLHEAGLLERTKLYATDINPTVLNKGKQGIFHLRNIKEYSRSYRLAGGKNDFSNYYFAKYDSAIFESFLRKNMVFSLHNLVSDQSFNEFNLILCRNVLIYFNKSLQNKVLNLFSESLVTLGYLALGNKESMIFSSQEKLYESINATEKIFRKIR